jgi:hypothetical protein
MRCDKARTSSSLRSDPVLRRSDQTPKANTAMPTLGLTRRVTCATPDQFTEQRTPLWRLLGDTIRNAERCTLELEALTHIGAFARYGVLANARI